MLPMDIFTECSPNCTENISIFRFSKLFLDNTDCIHALFEKYRVFTKLDRILEPYTNWRHKNFFFINIDATNDKIKILLFKLDKLIHHQSLKKKLIKF